QHDDVQRIARCLKSSPQTAHEREVGDQHGDRQRDAERGHNRRRSSHDEVAQVVSNRYGHDVYPVCLSESRMGVREALSAGTSALTSPTARATARVSTAMSGVTLRILSA